MSPRLGGRRIDLQEGIEDHLGGVKVDGTRMRRARDEVGQQPGPEPPLPRRRPEAGVERRLGLGDRIARGTGLAVTCENVPLGIGAEDHDAGLTSSLAKLAACLEGANAEP